LSDEMLVWLPVWSEGHMICIWSNWYHCHPIISCLIKIHNGFIFLVLVGLSILPRKRCIKWVITLCNFCISLAQSCPTGKWH